MKLHRTVTAAAVATAAAYGRHCYLSGYLKGREHAFAEVERIQRQMRRRGRA